MTGLLILVLTLSMTGCSTWKQIKQVVQDVLTVPETMVCPIVQVASMPPAPLIYYLLLGSQT